MIRLTRTVRAQAVQAWAGHTSVVAAVDASLTPLARYLPPRGRVGYTRPGFSWARAEDMGTFFMAQYALAPRVLVHGVVDDWMIAVPREGVEPEALQGYVLIQVFDTGIRLYRRQVPTP